MEKTNLQHKKLIEAALFITNRPLMLDDLAKITGVSSLGFIKELLDAMQKEYAERGISIIKTPEGWSMQVKQELLPTVAHLTKHADIPEGCKRTLALIAFKEPVKQSEIIKTQGNKAYSYIKFLLKKDLIKAERKGKTKILKLTKEFERYFGEEKEKIKEKLNQM